MGKSYSYAKMQSVYSVAPADWAKCTVVAGDDIYKAEEDDHPIPLTLAELNNLTRDLNLLKESAQLQGSYLKEKHLLVPETMFSWY